MDKEIKPNRTRKLLDEGKVFESLNRKQITTIVLWSIFRKKKMEKFLSFIEDGYMAHYAYLNAKI